jgi:hypothetical protein
MEILIKGDSTEAKFKHLQKILDRMFRRLNKTIIGVMPLIPIMGYCEEPKDSMIARYLIPCECSLRSLDFLVGKAEIDEEGKVIEPEFKLLIKRGTKLISDKFYKDKPDQAVEVDIKLMYNDILEISTDNKISSISHTLVFDVSNDFQTKKEFLIEELENLIEDKDLDSN